MKRPTIAIIGASGNQAKYGNKAVRAYLRKGYDVYPVNPKEQEIEGLPVYRSVNDLPLDRLDRVSIYLPPHVGLHVIEELNPNQVAELWLNPGSESPQLIATARDRGLNVVLGCSIVDIGESP